MCVVLRAARGLVQSGVLSCIFCCVLRAWCCREMEVDITNQMETEDHTIKDKKKLVKNGKKQLDEFIKKIEESASFLEWDEDEQPAKEQDKPSASSASSASSDEKKEVDEKGEPIAAAAKKAKGAGANGWVPLSDADLAEFDRKEVVKNITYLEDGTSQPNSQRKVEFDLYASAYRCLYCALLHLCSAEEYEAEYARNRRVSAQIEGVCCARGSARKSDGRSRYRAQSV